MISVRGLYKKFPGTPAPALTMSRSRSRRDPFFTLFGPSGCGKSTLLRCVAGLETPDAGEIEIGGTLVFSSLTATSVPPNKRRIGMVFQSYAIWPHMTVLENVAFPLEARKEPNVRERACAALETVGLAALEKRYASMLSGGQQQRVALARAIVAGPAVLLLDEPLSNLDAGLRDQMRGELQSLQKRIGLTTIYVTHDQTEALSMSDRIAVMSDGRFVEIGSPDELYYRPRAAFTARLIGGANVLEGTASDGNAGLTIVETRLGRLLSVDKAAGPVQVFVRPDKISPASGPGVNVLDCRVRERRFAGEITELDLVHGDDAQVLRCRVPTTLAVAVGHSFRVHIDPSDVRTFRCD
jgi:iron(III) transport system ATP-binding protein